MRAHRTSSGRGARLWASFVTALLLLLLAALVAIAIASPNSATTSPTTAITSHPKPQHANVTQQQEPTSVSLIEHAPIVRRDLHEGWSMSNDDWPSNELATQESGHPSYAPTQLYESYNGRHPNLYHTDHVEHQPELNYAPEHSAKKMSDWSVYEQGKYHTLASCCAFDEPS